MAGANIHYLQMRFVKILQPVRITYRDGSLETKSFGIIQIRDRSIRGWAKLWKEKAVCP